MSLLTGRGKYLSELEDFDKVKVESACKDIGSFVLNLKNALKKDWKQDKFQRLDILYSIISVGEISKTIRHDYFVPSKKTRSASAQWDKDIRHFKDLRDQICHDPERSLNFTMSASDFLVAVKNQGRITGYKSTGWSFEEYLDYVLDEHFLQKILNYTKESIVDKYY